MGERFDTAVIGGGPGGYVAAIRLGQLGKKACVIERGELGGVCLNWGCIPSKAVIHAAELRAEVTHAASYGVGTGEVPLDVSRLRSWKEGIVGKLHKGIAGLLKNAGAKHVRGEAELTGPHALRVTQPDGGAKEIEFDTCILGTGARPIELPFLPRSHPRVWTSEELLALDEVPERLVVLGGGVIGMETACSYAKLGSKVTVVELMSQVMPGTDPDLVKPVHKYLKKAGVEVLLEAKATGFRDTDDGAVLEVETKKGAREIPCDYVLESIGFRPNSEGVGLEAAGVRTDDEGFVPIDPYCRTNVEHVYAIGDLTGPPFLAHRASKQGIVAAEVIAGKPSMCDFQAMPLGVFCDPEVATVGLMEEEAREAGHDVGVGTFPLAALGRAMAHDVSDGMVKVVGDAKSGLLLGVGIVGPRANDLICEGALALEMGAMVEDLALTVHPHPTFGEAVCEAAEDALGHAIHVARPPQRRSPLEAQADQLLLKKA